MFGSSVVFQDDAMVMLLYCIVLEKVFVVGWRKEILWTCDGEGLTTCDDEGLH